MASPTEKHKGFPAGPPELGLSTRWRRAGGLSLWLVLPLGLPSALRAQSVTITEYPLPVASSATPGGISAGPDGALWFTEVGGNKIGRITMSGMITEYPVPTAASNPTAITNGPDGALWFTEYNSGKIGRITVGGVVTEYPVATANGQPAYSAFGITTGPDHALWFLQSSGSAAVPVPGGIGRITTGGAVAEYPAPAFGSSLCGITTGPDGALWFTEYEEGKIGRITTSGMITEYPGPTGGGACGITAGPDGALWFADSGAFIGRITTAGVITEYPVPNEYSGPNGQSAPAGITVGPDGALWFTDPGTGNIGRCSTAGVIIEYPVPTAASSPTGITSGPDGALWFTESSTNSIGRAALSSPPTPPWINVGGVVNAASYTAPVAPGSIASAFGNFLLSSPLTDTSLPLPTSLSGLSLQWTSSCTSATVACPDIGLVGQAPLFFVSGGQVNLQVPWEVPVTAEGQQQWPTELTAALNNQAGSPQTVTVAAFAPAIFTTDASGSGPGAILDASYNLVDSSNPTTAGAFVLIYCTGLGAVSNQPATGSPAPSDPLAWSATPTVTIGGVTATVQFSGLAPGYVGLYQVNAQVPAGSATGSDVPVVISMGSVASNTVTMAVQ